MNSKLNPSLQKTKSMLELHVDVASVHANVMLNFMLIRSVGAY